LIGGRSISLADFALMLQRRLDESSIAGPFEGGLV
jgi:hypothetical protein